MAPPPGGPEDKTPPEIARSMPEHDATQVARDSDVVLEFSEPVNRPSVEASLYLSPEPGRRLRYRWSGTRLILDYLDPLPENRTIVVTVGSQAKDMQGNPLETSSTVAFSTGDHIDRGRAYGTSTIPEGVRSIAIVAYQIGDTLPDPMRDAPDYRMQSGTDGNFELGYLAPGRYRLFALDDKNLDGMWSPASEWIGTASQDIEVAEQLNPRVTFAPSLQDTSPLAILRTRQTDALRIDLRLNRDVVPDQIGISDSVGAQTALYHQPDTSASGSWRVFIDRELVGDSATAYVEMRDTRLSYRFAVISRPDTSRPRMRESFPENRSLTRDIPEELIIIFDEPIMLVEDSLKAELRADTAHVNFTLDQSDPAALTIVPSEPFQAGRKYTFTLPKSLITDRAGNQPPDSLLNLSWYSYPPDSLGDISVTVRAPERGPWLIELFTAKKREFVTATLSNDNAVFLGYPQGEYLVRVVRDKNANERLDSGSILPFNFSEPFEWHPDTVSVRARWTAEVEFNWTTLTQP